MNWKIGPFEMDEQRYQPDAEFAYRSHAEYMISQQFLASFVGAIAILLPVVLWLGSWNDRVCFFDSISHFYFSQFLGNIFVGALVFIGTFLVAYRGENRPENKLATIAGLCAYGIALFPTTGPGCTATEFPGQELAEIGFSGRILASMKFSETSPIPLVDVSQDPSTYFELFRGVSVLHYGSAGVLFLFLAYYCFFVFTRVVSELHYEPGTKTLTRNKWLRNLIYRVSGGVILLSMAIIAIKSLFGSEWIWWDRGNWTFRFETAILWAFGVAWIVKGRLLGTTLLDQ